MAATCSSTRPSTSSSSITTHTRASPPSSKRLLSWPFHHYSFSQPIRLRRRENTAATPATLEGEVAVAEEEEPDDVFSDGEPAQMFKPFGTVFSIEELCCNGTGQIRPRKPRIHRKAFQNPKTMVVDILGLGVGLALSLVGPASAAEFPFLQLNEPSNALSLPTWAVHVSSVVEWITAMALVWQYGEKSGNESWKGLSWGMVPLLGGAFCACTWHFFYNSESLEVLVALQAALTVIGNATMCFAAFRIFKASEERSKNNP